jgi:hypothetical protein
MAHKMEKIFYEFCPEDEENCVTIKAAFKYKTLEMIGKESPFIESNKFAIAKGSYGLTLCNLMTVAASRFH